MSIQFSPHDGVTAKPLEIEDPLGQGWVLETVRSDSLAFQPFSRQFSKARAVAEIDETTLSVLRQIEEATEKGEDAAGLVKGLDEDSCIAVDSLSSRLSAVNRNPPAKEVSKLVVGWKGMKDADGNDIPFSKESLLSLLSDSGEMAVMNGKGPLVLTGGDYSGYTVGQALCHFLPLAVENATNAEMLKGEDVESKKVRSGSTDSSGRGSGTKAKK